MLTPITRSKVQDNKPRKNRGANQFFTVLFRSVQPVFSSRFRFVGISWGVQISSVEKENFCSDWGKMGNSQGIFFHSTGAHFVSLHFTVESEYHPCRAGMASFLMGSQRILGNLK